MRLAKILFPCLVLAGCVSIPSRPPGLIPLPRKLAWKGAEALAERVSIDWSGWPGLSSFKRKELERRKRFYHLKHVLYAMLL